MGGLMSTKGLSHGMAQVVDAPGRDCGMQRLCSVSRRAMQPPKQKDVWHRKRGGRIARILTQLQHCRKPHADGKRGLQADGHPAAAARRVGRRRHVAQEGGEESRYVEEHMQTPGGQASEYQGRAPEKQEQYENNG